MDDTFAQARRIARGGRRGAVRSAEFLVYHRPVRLAVLILLTACGAGPAAPMPIRASRSAGSRRSRTPAMPCRASCPGAPARRCRPASRSTAAITRPPSPVSSRAPSTRSSCWGSTRVLPARCAPSPAPTARPPSRSMSARFRLRCRGRRSSSLRAPVRCSPDTPWSTCRTPPSSTRSRWPCSISRAATAGITGCRSPRRAATSRHRRGSVDARRRWRHRASARRGLLPAARARDPAGRNDPAVR